MFEDKIRILEERYRQVDNQLFQLEKTGKVDPIKLKELEKQKRDYLNELRELRRKQYEANQTIDYGDDR